MPVHHDDAFPPAVALLLAGMLAPALVASLGRDVLALYLSGPRFALVSAGVFGVVAWGFIEWMDLDRTTVGLVSLAAPWPVLLASLFAVLLVNRGEPVPTGPVADVFRFLTGDTVGSFFGYGAAFALAGLGAVALSAWVDRLGQRHDWFPEARGVLVGLGVTVVIVGLLIGGVNHVTAGSGAIVAVESTVDDRRPALQVTVDGPPAERRVTAVAPDGTSLSKRLARADARGGTATVAFPLWSGEEPPPGHLPLQSGPYRIRMSSLAGLTVDATSFAATDGTAVAVTATEWAAGSIGWDDPPATVHARGEGDTKVGILIENGGSFHQVVDVTLVLPGSDRRMDDIVLAPGTRTGVVFALPSHIVSTVRGEHGGTVTARVDVGNGPADPVATVVIELPA